MTNFKTDINPTSKKKPGTLSLIAALLVLLFLCMSGFYSCKKDANNVSRPVNVYVAGYEYNGSNDVAKYWKNGNPVVLTDGSKTARGLSITVAGSDVYVAGYEFYRMNAVAKYWKNGQSVVLGDSSTGTFATSIAVSGADVYVAGYEYASGRLVARYWKNGSAFLLGNSANKSEATSIAISGTDVYVAGYESTGKTDSTTGLDLKVAKYWKNGTSIILSAASISAAASAIVVSGNDVYVVGEVNSEARYWKNSNPASFISNLTGASINAIAVTDDNVFLAGNESTGAWQSYRTVATYWKNGIPISITDGSKPAYVSSIAVSGNDVYVAGYQRNGVNPSTLTSQSLAKYWKNGTSVTLSDSSKYAVTTSIFLSEQ